VFLSPYFRVSILTIATSYEVSTSPKDVLSQALANLSEVELHSFFDLSYVNAPPMPTTLDIALAIFQTNAVAAGPGKVGLFPQTARLNHGCGHSFNSVYSWRESEEMLVVHALKPIKMGEVSLPNLSVNSRNKLFHAGVINHIYRHEETARGTEACPFSCI